MNQDSKKFNLFVGTFVSAFLLIFGLITLAGMFFPVLAGAFSWRINYRPQLPLSADRPDGFLDINSIPTKELYPPLAQVDNVGAGNWIRIPAIDVNVPLILSASLEDKDVLSVLDSGAALYPNGIKPGRLGNTFISAHSTGEPWKGKYRFAFLKINELSAGNVINVDYEGTRYSYRLTKTEIITPEPGFMIESGRPVPTVTLMACWPLWSTKNRMLVHGELTNITQLMNR